MDNNIKTAYWVFFTTPKEYGKLFFTMNAEQIQEIVFFLQKYSGDETKPLADLAGFIMSILFTMKVNG